MEVLFKKKDFTITTLSEKEVVFVFAPGTWNNKAHGPWLQMIAGDVPVGSICRCKEKDIGVKQ